MFGFSFNDSLLAQTPTDREGGRERDKGEEMKWSICFGRAHTTRRLRRRLVSYQINSTDWVSEWARIENKARSRALVGDFFRDSSSTLDTKSDGAAHDRIRKSWRNTRSFWIYRRALSCIEVVFRSEWLECPEVIGEKPLDQIIFAHADDSRKRGHAVLSSLVALAKECLFFFIVFRFATSCVHF